MRIDTRGKDCPIPLIELKAAIQASAKGEVIEVLFTCPEAVVNLPNYCQENNHKVLEFEPLEKSGWRIVVEN
ncbi:hypothetical protein ABB02_00730 [Clostridiaceae bacterium JG1575]|nr:hypothetical protein ABB02_00730 [Clostridiaceae bacterium JG1575]